MKTFSISQKYKRLFNCEVKPDWSEYWLTRTPSNLIALTKSETEIEFTWNDAVSSADGLRLYLSTNNSTFTLKGTIAYGLEGYDATGLTPTTIYYVRLVAYRNNLESDPITITTSTFNANMIAGWNFDETRDISSFSPNLADLPNGPSNNPSSIFYNNKTYITYNGKDDKPFIITYNHLTGLWSSPVNVGLYHRPDFHGQPCMMIDDDGYIHVMWGAHDSAIYYSISDNPEDITAWTPRASPASGTYPQLIKFSTGRIYLFYRIGGIGKERHFKTTDDNGATWSAATHLTTNFAYINFRKGVGDTILAAMRGNDTSSIAIMNLYYMWFDGTNWRNIDGVIEALPVVLIGNNVLAYNSGNYYIPNLTLDFDASNVPYILFSEGTVEFSVDYTNVKILRRSGGAWVVNSLGLSGHLWEVFFKVLDILADRIDVYISQTDIVYSDRWNIERWSSFDDGVTWIKIERIKRGGRLQVAEKVLNYNPDAKFVFSEFGQAVDTIDLVENSIRNNKGYLWGDSGIVNNSLCEYSDFADEVKNVMYGIKVGAPLPIVDSGICYEFHGSPDTVAVADNALLSFNGGSPDKPFSFSIELKASNTVPSQVLMGKHLPSEWEFNLMGNTIRVIIFTSPAIYIYRTAPYAFTGEWKFICVTYDGSGTSAGMKIYIDNVQFDNISGGAGVYIGTFNGVGNIYIGCFNLGGNYYVGKMRRLRIWNKVLSSSEMTLVKNNNIAW